MCHLTTPKCADSSAHQYRTMRRAVVALRSIRRRRHIRHRIISNRCYASTDWSKIFNLGLVPTVAWSSQHAPTGPARAIGGAHKKKGRLRCHKRPKSREETPKEGSDSGSATAYPIDKALAIGVSIERRGHGPIRRFMALAHKPTTSALGVGRHYLRITSSTAPSSTSTRPCQHRAHTATMSALTRHRVRYKHGAAATPARC